LFALAWFAVAALIVGEGLKSAGMPFLVAAVLPALAIYFLYHPVLEILMQGQTPGKRWIHLRVVTADGGTPSIGAQLVRNLFRILDAMPAFYALGLGVMFATRDQVRIGDLAAGTLVVYDLPPPAASLASAVVHEGPRARIVPLLEEWLERWPELDPVQRDQIAWGLLRKAGVDVGSGMQVAHSEALRAHVRQWLNDVAKAG
jgi:uncharacterized RDD family membrane protein YckC